MISLLTVGFDETAAEFDVPPAPISNDIGRPFSFLSFSYPGDRLYLEKSSQRLKNRDLNSGTRLLNADL
jgi:hypothetical protein